MIQIGECSFPTKKAVERRVRAMLAKYADRQRLDAEDTKFVLDLLELHPRLDTIRDCGIAYVYVEHRDGGRGFCVRRTDESPFDFRWLECLYRRNSFSLLSGICRDLVMDQKNEFRDRNFRGMCEVCGEPLRLSECQVDHIPPATFENLLKGWLKSVHMVADDIEIIRSNRYGVWSKFEDPFLAQQWVEYHEINARLRCVCRNCNLSFIRKTSPRNLVRQ
jgi:hypothetical protein